ncbi:MAG: hypothetical protein KGR17_06935 [Acidobacteria bacterium]|nr:hypothetical protein [Acidobacteriota bacterium]
MRERLGSAWLRYRRLTRSGWPRDFPIAQLPNPPLLVAMAGWLVGALAGGELHRAGRAVFYIGMAVWAWEELTAGVNWFRRLIGAGVLVWLAAQIASFLPA